MIVLGLDLSLTCTGMIAVSCDWGGDFSRCTVSTAGRGLAKDASETERAHRVAQIRDAVRHFATRTGATTAVREQYAMGGMGMLGAAYALGELGGLVRDALLELGLELEAVAPASARKLLGKQPRKGGKIWAAQRLVEMGAPRAWPMDCLDAFCVANWKLAELGAGLLAPEAA